MAAANVCATTNQQHDSTCNNGGWVTAPRHAGRTMPVQPVHSANVQVQTTTRPQLLHGRLSSLWQELCATSMQHHAATVAWLVRTC
jgi:hypothetical protein